MLQGSPSLVILSHFAVPSWQKLKQENLLQDGPWNHSNSEHFKAQDRRVWAFMRSWALRGSLGSGCSDHCVCKVCICIMESLCCLLIYPNLSPTHCPQIFYLWGVPPSTKGLTLPLNTSLLALILMQNWCMQYWGCWFCRPILHQALLMLADAGLDRGLARSWNQPNPTCSAIHFPGVGQCLPAL